MNTAERICALVIGTLLASGAPLLCGESMMRGSSTFPGGQGLSSSAQDSAQSHPHHPESSDAKQDMDQAGHKTKNAARSAGHKTKRGADGAYHATKNGTRKAAHKTRNTANGAIHGGKAGAKKSDRSTPR
jgi:hypothetical protein